MLGGWRALSGHTADSAEVGSSVPQQGDKQSQKDPEQRMDITDKYVMLKDP